MGIFAVRPEIQQRIAILVPLVALILSLFVVYPAWGHYNDLRQQIVRQQSELRNLKNTSIIAPGPVEPAADDMPSEPPAFLGEIRSLAAESHCTLVGFDISPSGKASDNGLIRAVRANIDMEATYVQIREFLFRLSHQGRLLAVTHLTLNEAMAGKKEMTPSGLLHATLEIERYVTPPTAKT